MEIGRDTEKLLKRLVEATERVATANEKLIALADEERAEEVEVQFGNPGYCPHCNTLSPRIRNEGGIGLLAEFVLIATCDNCGKTFYAIPEGWQVAKTPGAIREMMGAGNNGTP